MSRIESMSTRRKFILFALMAIGQFMALLDTQIVAASISDIQAGLAASTKPLLELFYYASGDLALGLESGPAGTEGTPHPLTTVPLGTKFSYVIELTGSGAITITINGTAYPFTMPASFNGYGMYFKAGDYDQTAGSSATVGATVKFYALAVQH